MLTKGNERGRSTLWRQRARLILDPSVNELVFLGEDEAICWSLGLVTADPNLLSCLVHENGLCYALGNYDTTSADNEIDRIVCHGIKI